MRGNHDVTVSFGVLPVFFFHFHALSYYVISSITSTSVYSVIVSSIPKTLDVFVYLLTLKRCFSISIEFVKAQT